MLCVVDLAEGYDVARAAVFVKHPILQRQRSHCLPTLRRKNRRIQRKLFSGLLADFHKRRIELAVTILLDRAENVPDDLFLPWKQQKRLSRPDTLGVLQALNERHRPIRALLVVMAGRQHEPRGPVCLFACLAHRTLLLALAHIRNPPLQSCCRRQPQIPCPYPTPEWLPWGRPSPWLRTRRWQSWRRGWMASGQTLRQRT